MNNIPVVKVVHGLEHLLYGLRCILLGELSLVTDSIEQLSTGG